MKGHTYKFWIAGAVSLCCLAQTSLSQAQITSDGTLSTEVITPDNLNFTITGGSRAEGNLFHSFGEFSVPNRGSASFNNALDVQNIISRVTGGSISNIEGLIRAKGSANLFLLNPQGITFGSNASLNIGGSFLASTANSLIFADGTFFSATAPPQAQPLLTISVPMGLQFSETGGRIRVIGQPLAPLLQVEPGKTLALVGGDVFIENRFLRAPEGRIELGSVAGSGLVSLNPIAAGWALGYEGVREFQNIQLSSRAFVDTSGAGSGAIQLIGRRIVITNRSVVQGFTLDAKPGESLAINASEFVEVSNSSSLSTATFGFGKAGEIIIKTPQLIVQNAGEIRAATEASGQAGNIIVDAPKSVEVIGSRSSINSQTFSPYENAGNAGTVRITTGKLILNGGGQIANSTTGPGDGGTLLVNASESVEVRGRSRDGINSSGLFAQSVGGKATGDAGILEIETRRLIVENGAKVSVGATEETFRLSRLGVSTGQGGKLRITASDRVEVTGTGTNENGEDIPSTLLAESQGPGAAGNLTIETDKLTVQDRAEVTVSSTGGGAAGNLKINADSIRLDSQGSLRAETRKSKGDITIQADDILLRRNSNITTNATEAASGGNIKINTIALSVLEDSNITANADQGRGGNIQITTQGLFLSPDSDITASSEEGIDGEVEINTLDDFSSGVVALPTELVDVSRLIAQGCSAGGGNVARGASKFVATGRGGLPPTPTEAVRSDAVLADLGTPVQGNRDRASAASTNPTNSQPTPLVEAQGWVIGSKGEVVLIAQAPTATPHTAWLTATTCNGS